MALNIAALADGLATELQATGTIDRAVNEKRYLKSELRHYGVSVPVIRKSARRFARE
ncbi:MAG: DNA alkylation repair protein, partial [Chloroflexi bacterium]|nr:DNA alkylation repair protein [Chloroflexota bacterium]